MKKIKFIESRKDAQWGFQLNDGRIIEVMSKEGNFLLKYDTPFSLETGEIYNIKEQAPEGVSLTTLNDLLREKKGVTVYCYDEYDINLGYIKNMTIKKSLALAKDFHKHGFMVSPRAIMHNFEAWKAGWKVGYRDEKRGYHLFSPCGGNPFSLRATTLEECCSDWQKTYLC